MYNEDIKREFINNYGGTSSTKVWAKSVFNTAGILEDEIKKI